MFTACYFWMKWQFISSLSFHHLFLVDCGKPVALLYGCRLCLKQYYIHLCLLITLWDAYEPWPPMSQCTHTHTCTVFQNMSFHLKRISVISLLWRSSWVVRSDQAAHVCCCLKTSIDYRCSEFRWRTMTYYLIQAEVFFIFNHEYLDHSVFLSLTSFSPFISHVRWKCNTSFSLWWMNRIAFLD